MGLCQSGISGRHGRVGLKGLFPYHMTRNTESGVMEGEKMGSLTVKIVRHDRTMEKIVFPVPSICEYLTDESKTKVFSTTERDEQGSKVNDFFQQTEDLYNEMIWQKKIKTNNDLIRVSFDVAYSVPSMEDEGDPICGNLSRGGLTEVCKIIRGTDKMNSQGLFPRLQNEGRLNEVKYKMCLIHEGQLLSTPLSPKGSSEPSMILSTPIKLPLGLLFSKENTRNY
eukprot:g46879.t1